MSTILYVEDNLANLKLVESIISAHTNATFLSATDGESGLQLAREARPDLIILDINMPLMDGYEVLRALKQAAETASIPVVALSAAVMPSEIEKGLQAGFLDYLSKPLQVNEFIKVINTHLAST